MHVRNLLAISDADFLAESVRARLEAFARWNADPDNLSLKLHYEFWLDHSQSFALHLEQKRARELCAQCQRRLTYEDQRAGCRDFNGEKICRDCRRALDIEETEQTSDLGDEE